MGATSVDIRTAGGRRAAGFTLIEVMIVVLIVGILAAIAMAGYDWAVVKSRRSAAAACALDAAQWMERRYTTRLTYADAELPDRQCASDLAAFYAFQLDEVSATAYTVEAVPQGVQASRDARCGTLSITHTGEKSVSGTGTSAECW